MYTLNPTDIDNGGEFFRKLNANFAEAANPQSSHTDAECRTRFIEEMNKKAALLGLDSTTFYEPAGNQPANYTDLTGYTDIWLTNNRNVMSAMDALRLTIYASGIQHINDAWNIQSFTLNYLNGTTSKTATINSTVFTSSTYQSSINALLADYDIFGGKTGSYNLGNIAANTLVIVARSKSTGKIYACVNWSTAGTAASDNKFIDAKKALDKVDAGGSTPSFSKGGCCVTELPIITPSLLNRADITLAYSYGKDSVLYPASVSKVMTALCSPR